MKLWDSISTLFLKFINKNNSEIKEKYYLAKKKDEKYRRKQWERLFSTQDYTLIKLLEKFYVNNNEWISLENIYSEFIERGYDRINKRHKTSEYYLFQIQNESSVRITPILYKEFKKEYSYAKRHKWI